MAKQVIYTQEQADIVDYVRSGRGNLVVRARAGSGKTTTMLESVKNVPKPFDRLNPQITICCFNAHIQKEIKEKVPDDIFVYTTHALGYGAICRKYGKVEIDEYKVHKIIRILQKKWGYEHREETYTQKLVELSKLARLTISLKANQIKYIASKYLIPLDPDGEDIKKVQKILELCSLDTKTIDFTDQVYMPATDKKIWMYPQDFIFIDEAQDLSKAQHYMLNKMIKRTKLGGVVGKFYAFGDDYQSIMSFSGSDSDSFEWFVQQENTAVLPLTQTFRCGKAIVKEANTIVSDVKASSKAVEGVVREGDVVSEATAGDFVLCRVNKPLVRLFFDLFLQKKKAIIKGTDLGTRIVELVNKYEKREDMLDELNYQLNKYRMELIDHGIQDYEKHAGYSSYKDFVDCVLLINKTITNISQFRSRVKEIFCEDDKVEQFTSNSIILSTIHKAKGLEANRVFIIKPQLLVVKQPLEWMDKQESNLKYVAITRAKTELIYDYKWTDEKESKS